jgi:Ca2+-binding EF-hand superfamily protein
MKAIIAIVVAGAGVIAATQSVAQSFDGASQEPDLTRQQARERADHLFDLFDANRDGLVTRAEAQRVGSKLMIARELTGRDVAPGIGGHTLRFLEQRFAGVDSVNKQQFEDALLTHFDRMDRNHDGVLTAAERLQAKSEQASR